MATSKSIEPCTATVAIYSGRPDPCWQLTKASQQHLENIWKILSPCDEPSATAPSLGYRGCTVDCGQGGIWIAFAGVVSRAGEHRADPNRQFERAILNSAPRGTIPSTLFRPLP